MSIQYKEIDAAIEEAIVAQYGIWVRDCNCIVRGNGCYLIAAMDNGTVAGFATIHPAQWIAPFDDCFDGFIEVIEVAKKYQRQGIGSNLVRLIEGFAKSYGYYQIRAWSSDDRIEALHMWHKLKYCMCPAAMLGQSARGGYENQQIAGYYCTKILV